jgi:uncharacterized protein YyaL (SSP411 family)
MTSRFLPWRNAITLLLLTIAVSGAQGKPVPSTIAWAPWSDQLFAQARATHRYVLMDLEAVWCHWCHVMDATTYQDPKIAALIDQHFIPVKVDQDARPDISRRFEIYGWPATILFDGEGNVIAHYRGYYEPQAFLHLLHAVLADPSPLHSDEDNDAKRGFAREALLTDTVRSEVERRYQESLDPVFGGLKQGQKFLDRDTVEYSLWRAEHGDAKAREQLLLTLDKAQQLIDPAWGGMYQYSTDGDWVHPHFEKIMSVQANALRLYALAYQQYKVPAYLEAARSIHRYLKQFLLSPEGAFYTSQDADLIEGEHGAAYFALGDADRRAQGMPRIDQHLYARENGWAIEALAQYYSATRDVDALSEALTAARWMKAHRLGADGLYRHDARDTAGPFLGDSLAMGRGLLALYAVTGDKSLMDDAARLARHLERFDAPTGAGFLSGVAGVESALHPTPNIDENIDLARFANLLFRYTGDARDQKLAARALRYLDTQRIALRFGTVPGILLANAEWGSEPLHVTIVGAKSDPAARALFQDALALPAVYRRIDWWDPKGPALARSETRFPVLDRATAFVCTERFCSLPLFDARALEQQVAISEEQVP